MSTHRDERRRQRERAESLMIVGASITMLVVATYLFALAGEPRSVWLVCDIMGAC